MAVAIIAIGMFVGVAGWGSHYFGWDDPHGKVQIALFTTFVLGAICGCKTKG